jgi:hypothetical protein
VESLAKPMGDRVLHAMAQAHPDTVDTYLLSMVLGCDVASVQQAIGALADAGLVQARVLVDGGQTQLQAPRITDRGMSVACGMACTADEAESTATRLEADTLRQLLTARIDRSRLPRRQTDELRAAVAAATDRSLIDTAKVWAHQPVSDWRAMLRTLDATRRQGQ